MLAHGELFSATHVIEGVILAGLIAGIFWWWRAGKK